MSKWQIPARPVGYSAYVSLRIDHIVEYRTVAGIPHAIVRFVYAGRDSIVPLSYITLIRD